LPAAIVFREPNEGHLAESIRNDLISREWSVRLEGYASDLLSSIHTEQYAPPAVLTILPSNLEIFDLCMSKIDSLLECGYKPILLIPEEISLPQRFYGRSIASVIVIGISTYDRVFEDLFKAMIGSTPSWLDVRVRPSQILRPTGVAWWSEDVFVADEKFEHVVRIGPSDSSVVLPGLFEPHHIHLDRRTLIVANKAADEILVCRLVDDMATDVESIRALGDVSLRKPHDVQIAHLLIVAADTDNDRVTFTKRNNKIDADHWQDVKPNLPLRAPCGIHVDGDSIWVADTFNHRIVQFDHSGNETSTFGSEGSEPGQFRFPVSILSWKQYVFVADEQNECLQVFRKLKQGDQDAGVEHVGKLASPWVVQPFGLSVNRENRLAIGDRKQKCIWLIDLAPALAELERQVTS
jgi:hypothetical protein